MEELCKDLHIEVCSGGYLEEIQHSLKSMTNYPRFPGAQPISFEKKHLDTIVKEKYFVCEKTDGIRLLMYTRYNALKKRRESIFLDRKLQAYYIPNLEMKNADMSHCDNSLFDGELVIDKIPFKDYYKKHNRKIPKLENPPDFKVIHRYLFFDLIYLNNEFMNTRTFDVRLGKLKLILKAFHKYRQSIGIQLCFTLELKMMLESYRLQEPLQHQDRKDETDVVDKLKHESDGLIFTKWTNSLTFGTDSHMYLLLI